MQGLKSPLFPLRANPLPLRLSSGVLALALAAAFAVWLAGEQPAEARRAAALQGEFWYALSMDGAQVGYLSTKAWRDLRGYWRFDSLMHFSLDRNPPVSISESLAFRPLPPYRLAAAEHWSRQLGAPTQGVVVQAGDDGAVVHFHRAHPIPEAGEPAAPQGGGALAPEWSFTLGDHLAIESWLARERPAGGARRAAKRLDFEAGRLVSKVFKVVEKNALGYRLASAAPLGATEIQLGEDFAPVEFSMAGLFKLRRSTKAEALRIRTPLHLTYTAFPWTETCPTILRSAACSWPPATSTTCARFGPKRGGASAAGAWSCPQTPFPRQALRR